MRSFITAFLISTFSLSVVAAPLQSDKFFYKESGHWTAFGVNTSDGPSCGAQTNGDDGSYFLLTQRLWGEQELMIDLKEVDWEFEGDGTAEFYFFDKNFKKNKKGLKLSANFTKLENSLIQIGNIDGDKFVPPFDEFHMLVIEFKGDNRIVVDLTGSSDAIKNMIECIKQAPKQKSIVPKDGPSNKIPADPQPKIKMDLPKVDS